MSYSSGVFTLTTSGATAVTGTTISSTAYNLLNLDFCTGLSTALLKDGTQTVTADITLSGYSLVSNLLQKQCASYQWTTWNPTDVAGTDSPAPATAVATSTATYYQTMANSSGTVTWTFAKAGTYLISGSLWCEAGAATTLLNNRWTIGGTATRYFTRTSIQTAANAAANADLNTIAFLVSATANQTLTLLPSGSVTSGGVTGDFTFSANASALYVGS